MKKIALILLVLSITFLLFKSPMEKKKLSLQKLTFNLQEGDPPTLHPHKGVDLRSRCLFLALYEPLTRRQPDGSIELAAAQKVEIDSSQTVYTFHLRPHQWSNGEPVTSHHYADAWKYALSPFSCCIRSDLFYTIKNGEKVKKGELPINAVKISTPDEKTLVVELENPIPYFLDLAATSFFSPLYQANDQEPTFGNGPFVVDEWNHDQKLVFHQNPFYWDRASVNLEEICFTMVKDPSTALEMYKNSEIDLVGDPFSPLPFDSIPSFLETKELKSKLISRIFYLLLNTNSYPLQNKSLRKALAFSIDRDELTEHVFLGEVPSISHLPKPLSLLDAKELKQHQEEPAQLFDQALKELNLTRETFPKLVLNYARLSGQNSLVQFVQDQWRHKLGIEVELVCTDWNTHAGDLRKKNYQIGTIHLTTLFQDPMFFFDLFRDKSDFCNYAGWEDLRFRSLLDSSKRSIDKHCRIALLEQAERLLMEEMPVIPIFTQNLQYLLRKDVHLAISDLGIYDFKRAKVLSKEN